MRDLPIGFIDSGFGGLTVVKQSLKQLPNESIIYLGDNARCPYGVRSLSQVKEFIYQLTDFLLTKGIKMLVIACNTGTAAALADLKHDLSIPVVGVIDAGSRAAIRVTQNNHIGVIATPATIESQAYPNKIHEKSNQVQVDSLACPTFVDVVEKGTLKGKDLEDHIQETLQPLLELGIDSLVLGCTHYPHLYESIQKVAGPQVALIDSGVETINQVSTLLDYFKLSRTVADNKRLAAQQAYYTTGDPQVFGQVARTWLKDQTIQIQSCTIQGGQIYEVIDR